MPVNLSSKSLTECLVCGRSFEESRLCFHQDICKKSVNMKRKPFDSFKQRIRGTALEKHVNDIKARLQPQTQAKMHHGNWRKAHEEFINTIKAAKRSQKKDIEDNKEKDPCIPSMSKYSKLPK